MLIPSTVLAFKCTHFDGDCTVSAEYLPDLDVTVGAAVCLDGFIDSGLIGGNEAASLCVVLARTECSDCAYSDLMQQMNESIAQANNDFLLRSASTLHSLRVKAEG